MPLVHVDPSVSQSFVIIIAHLSYVLTHGLIALGFSTHHGVYVSALCAKYPVLGEKNLSYHNVAQREGTTKRT
jgi:hypothetical protein